MSTNVFALQEQRTQSSNSNGFAGVRANWAEAARHLPRQSLQRVGVDLAVWAGVAVAFEQIGNPALSAVAVVLVGAAIHHDLLVHGHEATHRLASHNKHINEFLLWFVHALSGLSGAAYRDVHLGHHRHTRTAGDPEIWFLARPSQEGKGTTISAHDYFKLPVVAHRKTWLWFRSGHASPGVGRGTAVDLIGVVALHLLLGVVVGLENWLIWCVAPIVTGLAVASAVRSLCEHHGCENNLGGTRAMVAGRLVGKLWSNVDHHFEHHLIPTVPHTSLPAVRRELRPFYGTEGVMVDRGYMRTAWRLLRDGLPVQRPDPRFWVNTRSVAFKIKQAWATDVLSNPDTKRRLLNLYYLGEAYEELHPTGVFVEMLPQPWSGLLSRHLAEETVHAEIFTRHLAKLGHEPELLRPEDDLGWQLLNHVVPDVVAAAHQSAGKSENEHVEFTRIQTMRYLAFLHALESRSIGDLVAVEAAARATGDPDLASDIRRILVDERFHATYTLRGVYRLAENRAEARAVLGKVLSDEQYFYNKALQPLLAGFKSTLDRPTGPPMNRVSTIRFAFLATAAKLGVAAPQLALRSGPPSDICESGLHWTETATPIRRNPIRSTPGAETRRER